MIIIKADIKGVTQLSELNLLFKKDDKLYLKIDDLTIPITTKFKYVEADLDKNNDILEEITSVEFITKYKNLWKDGEKRYKCGSENMGSLNTLKDKFKKFHLEYPKYTGEEIMIATKNMIDTYKQSQNGNDFTYIKRPPGFIWGEKVNTVTNGIKLNTSKMLIDYLLEEENGVEVIDNIDKDLQERYNLA